jgi:sugar phosphate isomerase/epimerase
LTDAIHEMGLKVVGAHVGFGALQEDLGGVVAEQKRLGNTHLVCPSIPGPRRTAEGYVEFAKELESIAREASGAGMTLCYHNHDFELKDKFDGQMGSTSCTPTPIRSCASRNRHFLDSEGRQ